MTKGRQPKHPDVSNGETVQEYRAAPEKRLSAATLRQQGWTVRDAADYLGVSRQRLYSVFADPGHARLWDLALTHLPLCTPALAQELKAARRAARATALLRSAAKLVEAKMAALVIGDVVVAVAYVGALADEGDSGWIADLRGPAAAPEMLVQMNDVAGGGAEWFGRDEFDRSFMTNGKTRQGTR